MSAVLPATDDLRTFVFVARLASFTRAALQLQVPRSTVSTTIKRLETQLGARLLQRTTRSVVLTPEGQALLGRSQRLLDEFEELAFLFRGGDGHLRGRLRVDLPLGMSAGIVMAALPEFMDRHPALQVDVFSTDRRVDVIAEGFDCVVRAGSVADETLACRRLGELPLRNVVSRRYIEMHGEAESVPDLARHCLVRYQPNPSDLPVGFEYWDGRATVSVPMAHRVTVDNSAAYGAACRAGFGIAQLPQTSVAQDVRSGLLVEVMKRYLPAPMPLNLLYPHRSNIPARVRVFGDWLLDILGKSMSVA
ncbi:LysR family transcriptional regulator [Robbsia sp. Bb-Pol-6]|uniref:LysR family transcriptional regulator n=1 Tax=Robbsia betulipollinis TaxID=2981849 RepID=A0ABT3ZS33_9BURK|nr:LysR family transcriptional regulator [Robbsia betulipollinis]MCY0389359.1 LysR family transcriptional regulator [Robbsia betulipollinis]